MTDQLCCVSLDHCTSMSCSLHYGSGVRKWGQTTHNLHELCAGCVFLSLSQGVLDYIAYPTHTLYLLNSVYIIKLVKWHLGYCRTPDYVAYWCWSRGGDVISVPLHMLISWKLINGLKIEYYSFTETSTKKKKVQFTLSGI